MHKEGVLAPVIATGEDVSVEVCDVRCVYPREKEPEVGLPQGLCLCES